MCVKMDKTYKHNDEGRKQIIHMKFKPTEQYIFKGIYIFVKA